MKQFIFIALFFPLCVFSNVRELIGTYNANESSLPDLNPPVQSDSIKENISTNQQAFKRNFKAIVDVEFLYWYGNVTNLSYAKKLSLISVGDATNPTTATLVPLKKENLNWKWDSGLRLGLGLFSSQNNWEIYSNWTYFYNKTATVSSVPIYNPNLTSTTANPPGTNVLTSPWIWFPDTDAFKRIQGNWNLLFNQIDLNLGYSYKATHSLSLNPFVGLRGYSAHMGFHVKASRPALESPTIQNMINSRANYQQHSWAVGLLTGINTYWHITQSWSIFALADIALAYGKSEVQRKIDYLQLIAVSGLPYRDVHYKMQDCLSHLQPFIDLGLGFRFETLLYQTYRILFELGWESHFLPNFSKISRGAFTGSIQGTFYSDGNSDYPSSKGNLNLSGGVLRGKIEF